MAVLRVCRGCGCTDLAACPEGCSWVLMDFAIGRDGVVPVPSGICSQCAENCEWDMIMMANALCEEAVMVSAMR